MGWSFRKSVRLLPGIRLNFSKSGPRLSVGMPGARASIDVQGNARIYAGKGPLRFQKSISRITDWVSPGGKTRFTGWIQRITRKR